LSIADIAPPRSGSLAARGYGPAAAARAGPKRLAGTVTPPAGDPANRAGWQGYVR
jgi:hypothetical protein